MKKAEVFREHIHHQYSMKLMIYEDECNDF